MTAAEKKELGSPASSAAPFDAPQPSASATYARRQRVVVIHGRLTNGYATGHYAKEGTIVSTRRRRHGWYGVEFDGHTDSPRRASVHVSGLKVN